MRSRLPLLHYRQFRDTDITDDLKQSCRKLFNEHYGVWSTRAPRPGERIRLPTKHLSDVVSDRHGVVSVAYYNSMLVGYAFAARFAVAQGTISWVAQLVVHGDFQNKGVATRLLNSIWAFSDDYGWGLVSANPFAIRALEKATRRRCDPGAIAQALPDIQEGIWRHVPYLDSKSPACGPGRSLVNTKFYVDQSQVPSMLERAVRDHPWVLGSIADGEEWFAVTLSAQAQLHWTPEEWDTFMGSAADIVVNAYDRMAIGVAETGRHNWTIHTTHELDWLVEALGLKPGQKILDIGCGLGRHAIGLAQRGFEVVGVDFSAASIEYAQSMAERAGVAVRFVHADCRKCALDEKFDAALCLYDVVGSFPLDDDNRRILKTIAAHVDPGIPIAVSVMNLGCIADRCRKENVQANPNVLLSLPASMVMETTGNVFDPKYLLLDPTTRVVYRRERFGRADQLPIEVIVRDQRYDQNNLLALCESAGFETTLVRPVQSGHWNIQLAPTDSRAKELLYTGRKR
jgi:2-polyprenyl-3-methyl-5-hydroxy-6-metoxy-1,4-benzoquinol methylase/GNAT superfamily N-acetyltransferase